MGAKLSQIINKSPTLSRILPPALKPPKISDESPKVMYILPSKSCERKKEDFSRIKQEFAQKLYQATNESGLRFIDSLVSPRIVSAPPTLTYMLEGDKKIVKPSLQCGVLYCGTQCNQLAELCDNFILSSTQNKTVINPEGFDPQLLAGIMKESLNGTSLHNRDIQKFCEDGFMLKLIAKDLSLAAQRALSGNYPFAISQELYKIIMIHRNMILQDCRK